MKAGITFKRPSFKDGVYSWMYTDEDGKIHRIGHLPAKSFDVVAVLVQERKVVRTDVKRIILRDGETTHVSMDLRDY